MPAEYSLDKDPWKNGFFVFLCNQCGGCRTSGVENSLWLGELGMISFFAAQLIYVLLMTCRYFLLTIVSMTYIKETAVSKADISYSVRQWLSKREPAGGTESDWYTFVRHGSLSWNRHHRWTRKTATTTTGSPGRPPDSLEQNCSKLLERRVFLFFLYPCLRTASKLIPTTWNRSSTALRQTHARLLQRKHGTSPLAISAEVAITWGDTCYETQIGRRCAVVCAGWICTGIGFAEFCLWEWEYPGNWTHWGGFCRHVSFGRSVKCWNRLIPKTAKTIFSLIVKKRWVILRVCCWKVVNFTTDDRRKRFYTISSQ